MYGLLPIFNFLIFIISIIVHEVAHGLMAEHEGDPTARMLGRITLNPLKHMEWFGSVILPILLYLSNIGIIVGWAKPVPYNPDNVRNGNTSIAKISIAGIVANMCIALFFGLIIRVMISSGVPLESFIEETGKYYLLTMVVILNILLALFNAIPIAPLDGFRFLSAVLPARFQGVLSTIERYSLPLLIVFIFFGFKFVAPFAFKLYALIAVAGT